MSERRRRLQPLRVINTTMQRRQHIYILISIFVVLLYTFWQRLLTLPTFGVVSFMHTRTENREPTIYNQQLTTKMNVLALGDSLTEGLFDWPANTRFHPYTLRLQQLFTYYSNGTEIVVTNRGVSGDTVRKIKKRLLLYLSNQTQDLVVVLAGTNDLLRVIRRNRQTSTTLPHHVIIATAKNISRDIIGLHKICHRREISTVVVTLPEIKYERYDNTEVSKRLRKAINRKLKKYAFKHKRNTIFANLAFYLEKLGRDSQEYAQIWDDGVHLTPYGYNRMGEYIYRKISRKKLRTSTNSSYSENKEYVSRRDWDA